jgi:DNA-binding SARP family transcriptional activator
MSSVAIPRVQIYLLGRFEVTREERVLQAADWSRHNAAALLQRLALERRLLKDQAIEFLWPEARPESGANNLYQTLYTLRQALNAALGPGTAEVTFHFEDGILQLNQSAWVDAHEFERLCSSPQFFESGQEKSSIADLQQALSLYQGDLLPDDLYTEWTLVPREALCRLHRKASLALAAHHRETHDYAAATALLQPLLKRDPADEPIHRELMRLCALDGRRHRALRQYQACTEALAADLGVAPDPETEALYAQILSGDVMSSPAPMPKPIWMPPAPITFEVEQSAPLVGREDELESLGAKIRASGRGQGCTILLAGDAGVGKTRLAYEALRTAASFRMTTLVGAAYEQEGQLPYQPFVEAFDRYLAEQRRPPEQHPITHFKPLGSSDPQQEHSALFKATATFLTGLATRSPVVLLLDDLHAADESSLRLFHYLARQTQSAPLILLATCRSEATTTVISPFGSLLNALYRERLSQMITLAPLPESGVAQIMNHVLGGEAAPTLIKAVAAITEGNPFFVQEITRAVLKTHALDLQNGQWRLQPGSGLRIPSRLQEVLRERVQRLGPAVESALTAAAVVGREFRFAVLQGVADLPDDELLDALDVALAGHLIEETQGGYRFRHPLIRHTLYDALSRTRRTRLHTRAAEAIEAAYAPRPQGLKPYVEALAFQYDLSSRRDRALPYLLQAGQKAAAIYAFEVASDYFERALTLMDELRVNDPAQRWMILEQLGWWGAILADTPRAVAHFEQALALAPTEEWQPNRGDRVRMHRAAAVILITSGDMVAAGKHLRTAMDQVDEEEENTADYAYLLYDVALWHWHRNEYQEAFDVAQRSLDIAQRLKDDVAIARAFEMLALAAHSLGDWQAGLNFEEQRSLLVGPSLDVTEAFDVHL